MAQIVMEKHAKAMLSSAIYFNDFFLMEDYGAMLGLKGSSHNMNVGIDVLV